MSRGTEVTRGTKRPLGFRTFVSEVGVEELMKLVLRTYSLTPSPAGVTAQPELLIEASSVLEQRNSIAPDATHVARSEANAPGGSGVKYR
jgi:hypothetical protein